MERVVLLADPNSNAGGFAEKIKDYLRQEKGESVPLEELQITDFRNGEFLPHVPHNIRKKDSYYIQDSTKDPSRWWTELLLIKDLLQNSSAENITFVLPNLLWSRQDRKHKPHVPISARALANSLSYPFPIQRLITMDLHADQVQGSYPSTPPFDNLHSFPRVVKYFREHPGGLSDLEELAIVSPDAGGVDRAKAFSQKLNSKYPVSFVYKRRDGGGDIEEMIFVGEVKDRHVLIVDDMIDSGGTLCNAAESLKEHGAKNLWCYGTHGLFTKGVGYLSQHFDRILTSNTHYQPEGKNVEIIDLSPVFAEAIYRAQKGESISELFDLENNNH